MFKIGEFSKLVRVSARMLRYYEQCGLLKPTEIDKFTSYRLYGAEQIPMLFRITELRDMGFSVEEMLEILPRFSDTVFMRDTLKRKSREVLTTIATEQNKLAKITALSGKIEKENQFMVYDVELKALAAEKVLSLREVISSPENEPSLWERMTAFIKANNIVCGKGGYSLYHDEEYKDSDVDIEIAVPVTVFGNNDGAFQFKELPTIPQAATIRFSGSYEGYGEAMEKLAAWIEENGYCFDGEIRGHGIVLPGEGVKQEDYLTELQVPVKKA